MEEEFKCYFYWSERGYGMSNYYLHLTLKELHLE